METITLTFGDAGENHVGMEIIGTIGDVGSGYNLQDLMKAKQILEKNGVTCILKNLKDLHNVIDTEDAYILIIKNGVRYFINESNENLFNELITFEWDTKYFDTRRGRVLNKHARSNVLFGDLAKEPNYEEKQGRIISYNSVPLTQMIKNRLPEILGEKGKNIICEGNRYFNINKCGIGWHGDSERKKVIGVRIGATIPLKFKWFHRYKGVGNSYTINLEDGDMYIMSEKATGYDWKRSSIYTLRHCAGCEKYTKEK